MTLKGVGGEEKQCIGIRFLPREFCWFFFCLVQSQKNDYSCCDLFKVSKVTILIMACSKSAKSLVDLGLRLVVLNNYLDVCLCKFKISRPK